MHEEWKARPRVTRRERLDLLFPRKKKEEDLEADMPHEGPQRRRFAVPGRGSPKQEFRKIQVYLHSIGKCKRKCPVCREG